MRLIDADTLVSNLKLIASSPCNCDSCDSRCSKTCIQCVTDWALSKAPTIELKQGRWLAKEYDDETTRLKCSECRFIYFDYPYEYCPHCGAEMKDVINEIS